MLMLRGFAGWAIVTVTVSACTPVATTPTITPRAPTVEREATPPNESLRWLPPISADQAFPRVNFTESGAPATWAEMTPIERPVWSVKKGAPRGVNTSLCRVEDGTWRAVIQSYKPQPFDVVAYPSGQPVTVLGRNPFVNSGVDERCETRPIVLFDPATQRMQIVDETSGEIIDVDGTFPAVRHDDTHVSEDRRVWTFIWKDESVAVDVQTRTATRVARPADRAPEVVLPGYDGTCRRLRTVGEFVELACVGAPNNRIETLLWHPGARTVRVLQPTEGAAAMLDLGEGRWLTAPGQTAWIASAYEPSKPRVFYQLADQGRALRRYDLVAATYTTVRAWDAKACAGAITIGGATADGRTVWLRCALPSTDSAKPLNERHVWSEVLDLANGRVWHTRKHVDTVAAGGLALVTNRTVLDLMSHFDRAWIAALE